MNGFINLDKPQGLTSQEAVDKVKRILKVAHAGHAGNLDPHATGVLLIGIDRGTKFLPYIMEQEKEYVATFKLGLTTDTLDTTGEILATQVVPPLVKEAILQVLHEFEGDIFQVPPAFSAARVQGQRLYNLARAGIFLKLPPKKVKIFRLELLGLQDEEITVRATVGKGTYIRVLAQDIAKRLGTLGIVKDLVRTRIGKFELNNAIQLDKIRENLQLLPLECAVHHFTPVYLHQEASYAFLAGSKIGERGILGKPGPLRNFSLLRIYSKTGDFLGVGMWRNFELWPKKIISP